ncbi:hypothetical protein [Nodosilinea nodulosa]|uniref:hypothetical protein n=1 Tax=Nodosilinea nodulosa TaxID=416001 RepID=UPI0002EBAC31|nr:hypothetical protein [Nodosilinea nodulosa]
MASKKNKQRLFSGMGYRAVQRSNRDRKSKLPKPDRQWLKENGYKNAGWDNVIALYQKINDILASASQDESSLEELFLQADKIGEKYQTPQEIAAFNQALNSETKDISALIDQQFPDAEFEFADYSKTAKSPAKRKSARNHKNRHPKK